MPVCTLHLLHLSSSTTLPTFLSQLHSTLPTDQKPLTISRVIRWIIRPTRISVPTLLDHPWDLLVILPGTGGLPSSLLTPQHIAAHYTLSTGIPSNLLKSYTQTNDTLLHPSAPSIPALTGSLDKPRIASSAQNLEFSPDLQTWLPSWESNRTAGKGAVSMLNLLAFKEGMHTEYLKYGAAFASSIGKRRGGVAKIVGRVVPASSGPTTKTTVENAGKGKLEPNAEGSRHWDEIALAHYPSFRHFADMAASEDYQEVNMRYRVPSLRDTCILMTSEIDLPAVDGRAKL